MNINELVLYLTVFIVFYNLYKIFYLKTKTTKKQGKIVDFKEKASKRYMYFLPILKVNEKEELIVWEDNPKLDKGMLNKDITLLVNEDGKIFEERKIIINSIIILISLFLAVFAMKNLNLF